jgi:hypothetical protein
MRKRLLATTTLLAAVAVSSCYDPDRITAPDEIVLLTASPAAIPANGFSTSRITARITTSTTRTLTITFSTSGGQLSSTAPQSPDANGEASVFLTSEASPKAVSVTADVKEGANVLASRSVAVAFDIAPANTVLNLTTSSSQVDADGASSVTLRADANPAISPGNRSVTFKTTIGSFERDKTPEVTQVTVNTASDGVAIAQLYAARTAGTALVTATSGGFSASQTITFAIAAPDFVSLGATPLSGRALETTVIDLVATLSRAIGKVTPNTRVDFTVANDASGNSFGRFQNIGRSKEDETVAAEFVPGAAAPIGLATITARVPGTSVTASVKVDITP